MKRNARGISWLATLAATLPLGGCTLSTDLFNQQFLGQLGVVSAIVPQPTGSVVVVLQNLAADQAIFGLDWSKNATDTDLQGIILIFIELNGSDNFVIDCPVTGIVLGDPNDSSEFDFENFGMDGSVTAQTFQADGTVEETEVAYEGPILRSGSEFDCGDVIIFSLITDIVIGDDGTIENDFRITVEVLPGL